MAKKTQVVNYNDETKVHPALTKYVGYCLMKSSAWLKAIMCEELEKIKVYPAQLGLLKVIEANGLISQIKLGAETGIDKASIVKLIDDLESKKMVERIPHPTDRRVKNIQMTAHGKKVFNTCHSAKVRAEKKFFSQLSNSEEQAFRKMILKLLPPTTNK